MNNVKQAAKTLKSTIESMGYKMPLGHVLDLIAKLKDTKDWNVLSAILKIEEQEAEWDGKTPMTDKQFVSFGGAKCPVCGGDHLDSDGLEADGDTAWARVTCSDCNSTWNDLWKISGYTDLEEGEISSTTEVAHEDCGHISAEAHSDDRYVEVSFNAAPWFKAASDKAVLELIGCGWGGDYPADNVVHHTIDMKTPDSDALISIFKHSERMGQRNQTIGFECSVDENDAMKWLRKHRNDLWLAANVKEELEAQGFDFSEDSDQPGMWVWTAPSDGCDSSFSTLSEAIVDCWHGVVPSVMAILNLSSEEWDALSIRQQASKVDEAYSAD